MTEDKLKEIKDFRMQMKLCSITTWIGTIGMLYAVTEKPEVLGDLCIIPIGAVIFTYIWLKTTNEILKYERYAKPDKR